jgi:hypothetical protein
MVRPRDHVLYTSLAIHPQGLDILGWSGIVFGPMAALWPAAQAAAVSLDAVPRVFSGGRHPLSQTITQTPPGGVNMSDDIRNVYDINSPNDSIDPMAACGTLVHANPACDAST